MCRKLEMLKSSPKQLYLICTCMCFSVMFHYLCQTMNKREPYLDINKTLQDKKNINLVFIGGSNHSGASLTRAILDSHQDIHCRCETWLMEYMLGAMPRWTRLQQKFFLVNAGVYPEALDEAMAQFMLEIILSFCPNSKLCCYKSTFMLSWAKYVHRLFPNAKFIHMVRDPRAVVHSEMSQMNSNNVTHYWTTLKKWNDNNLYFYDECADLGKEICLIVKYEQLVLKPVMQTKRIFKFLGIPWNDEVLHHERHINKSLILRLEPDASEELFKPLNLDGLTKWIGNLPKEVEEQLKIYNEMKLFGYDPEKTTPKYDQPDDFMMKMMAEQKL
ncbi:protein-tyrosine sulfotransferase 1-like [Styela clava]